MKKNLLTVATALLFAIPALAGSSFPTSPDQNLTPGSLCVKPESKRYPEGILYCGRKVGGALKREVMEAYDSQLGYGITSMNRGQFKIDHYIPLCMGGSNNADNLWPQHSTVYAVTDPLEQLACEKMARGKLRQADAVQIIKRAKANLSEVPAIIQQVQSL